MRNLSDCDDTHVMRQALRTGKSDIDIQAAGTAMRFLTAFLAGTKGVWTITGTERMKNRPIRLLVDALRSVGAHIEYMEKDGFPPLRITGRMLRGGEVSLDGSVSSQYISALLMVAPTMENGLRLHLTGEVISRPYVQLTAGLMKLFGVEVAEDGETLAVSPQPYKAVPLTVEADWSAASYWYEMAAFSAEAEVTLRGLFPGSLQGDAAIAALYEPLGVETFFRPEGVVLKRTKPAWRAPLHLNLADMPDMAQTLAVTCAMLNLPFCFDGLRTLKIKETDRLAALCTELRRFGYVLVEREGGRLEWNGERREAERRPVVRTYEDHRMAMAFAPVAICRATEGVRIANTEVVSKSYPHFWDDLRRAGFHCSEEQNNAQNS
jgi:3-phosphoshikimate 1-carboxyvinyltransferase